MNDLVSIYKKAEQAGVLWRSKDFRGARNLYEEIISSITVPLDKAKTMGNIAQLHYEEGNKDGALCASMAALEIVNDNELYKSLEGAHLRGYLTGFINRLQNKRAWEPVWSDRNIPLEMNLSIFDRLRAHLSVTIISGVLFSIVSSGVKLPSIDISIFNENIIVFSSAGFLFSILFTSDLLKLFTTTVFAVTNREVQYCLKAALNLLSLVAILYLFLFHTAFWSLVSELVVFFVTGILGVAVFYGFIYRRHGRNIE